MKHIELKLFGQWWNIEILQHSNDVGDFDIQTVHVQSLRGLSNDTLDLTDMVDSVSSLQDQFDGAIIMKLKEEQDNV